MFSPLCFINQIVVGSFLAGNQHEQKPKKQKTESVTTALPTAADPISSVEVDKTYGGPETAAPTKPNFSSSSFRGDNWSSLAPESRNQRTDINVALHG